jgi:hypothetical protein
MTDDDERRLEWEALRAKYRKAIDEQFHGRPDLRGKIFRPRGDTWAKGHTPMSFSRTLLDLAGGIWDLERDWEPEK